MEPALQAALFSCPLLLRYLVSLINIIAQGNMSIGDRYQELQNNDLELELTFLAIKSNH